MQVYRASEVAWFFSSKIQPELFALSNMSQVPLVWRGLRVCSSETLYQASKYHPDTICLPHSAKPGTEPRVQKRITQAKNAMGSKMTQKCAVAAGLVRPDWGDILIHVMQWVLELKLQQHSRTFGAVLKSTGAVPIVEVSRKDQFWGCVRIRGKNDFEDTFHGENVLGKLLTNLRGRYDWVVAGNLTNPEGFLLL